jgi:hypothetical protein
LSSSGHSMSSEPPRQYTGLVTWRNVKMQRLGRGQYPKLLQKLLVDTAGCAGRFGAIAAIALLAASGCAQPKAPESTDFKTEGAVESFQRVQPGSEAAEETLVALGVPAGPEKFPRREFGDEWGRFLGPSGNGHSSETGVAPELWQPHPPILWTLPLGVGYGAPAVVGECLYQFDRYDDCERLTCYDLTWPKELWRWEASVEYEDMYGYNNGPRCSPIIDDDLIFLYGVAGGLYCIERSSGTLIWERNINREYGVVTNFFGVASNPVVHEDLLLVMVGGSPARSHQVPSGQLNLVEPNGTAIAAFDKRTGEQRYLLGDDLASYASLTVQQVAGRATGLAFLRNGLLAWLPETGEILFDFPWRADMLESVNAAVPVTDGQRVLISESYQVGSALLDGASLPWQVAWSDGGPRNRCRFRAHWATPVLVDGYIYGCSGRNPADSDFRCVRWVDGQVMWTERKHERSSVLVVDGYLVVLGEYGSLELIRPNSTQWEVVRRADLGRIQAADGQPYLQYPCWAAPVLSHGLLYVRGNDRMLCMRLIP